MRLMMTLAGVAACAVFTIAAAAPAEYAIDADHTFPSFEADHMGISVWRGKLNKSSGKVMLDKEGGAGTVDLTMDLSSIDFGHDTLNKWAVGPDFFDVSKYPTATYKGRLEGFRNGAPSRVVGELTLHGVTKPVTLQINLFKCIPHPIEKRDYCGADAVATFKRDEFGLPIGKEYGFSMDVNLRIQVEALRSP